METQRVHEVVHTLRQKPLHVRENIALGVALGVTAIVAVGWLTANAAAGTFAFGIEKANDTATKTVADTGTPFSQLAAAAGSALGASSSPATVTVVDTQVHSTLDQPQVPADQTVIHF